MWGKKKTGSRLVECSENNQANEALVGTDGHLPELANIRALLHEVNRRIMVFYANEAVSTNWCSEQPAIKEVGKQLDKRHRVSACSKLFQSKLLLYHGWRSGSKTNRVLTLQARIKRFNLCDLWTKQFER